jgi:hypothetical protein
MMSGCGSESGRIVSGSDLDHPVVLVQGEASPRQLDIDRHAVILDVAAGRSSTPNVRYGLRRRRRIEAA